MNTVRQLSVPLYELGDLLPSVSPRRVHTVRAPGYPLYEGWALHGVYGLQGLGQGGAKILAASAPIASKAATGIIGAFATQGGALASMAGPIGAGIAVLVGVIAGLWAAHAARVKGATAENQAINSAVNTWDSGMRAIFAAANSTDPATNVSGAQAAAQVQALWSQFWQAMSPYMHAPGTADTSQMGVNCGSTSLNPAGPCAGTPGGHQCDKNCTASCCVGCQDLYPSMLQAIAVLNSPTGGQVQVCTVSGSKYGAQQRAGYTLTYTPPQVSAVAGTSGGILSSLTSGGSLLPLLLVGAVAFIALRK